MNWGKRHTLALMCFFGLANLYSVRVLLSVAIVDMVNKDVGENSTNFGTECPIPGSNEPSISTSTSINTTKEIEEDSMGEFDWDAETQGFLLGCYFYGYTLMQIPGGLLAERFGAKFLFALGICVPSLLTLASPIIVRASFVAFVVTRIAEGAFHGLCYPCINVLISHWLPPDERNLLVSVIGAGAQGGNIMTLALGGILADTLDWPWVFYFFGVLGCLASVLWLWQVHEKPSTHPKISTREEAHLRASVSAPHESMPFPPLRQMLTSSAVLALMTAFFAQDWVQYTILTEMPTYLNNVQHLSLSTTGLLTALSYVLFVCFAFLTGFLADLLHRSKLIKNPEISRKIFQSIAMMGAGIGLLWLAVVGCNAQLAVVALCLAIGLNGAVFSGYHFNHVDLSPNYAGTLMGVTNAVGNIAGFLAPLAVGFITQSGQTLGNWFWVFVLGGFFAIGSNVVFLIWAKADIQSWNTYWILD